MEEEIKKKVRDRKRARLSCKKITLPMWSQFELLSLLRLIPLCPPPRRLTAGRVVTRTAERGNNEEEEEEGRHLDHAEQGGGREGKTPNHSST